MRLYIEDIEDLLLEGMVGTGSVTECHTYVIAAPFQGRGELAGEIFREGFSQTVGETIMA